MRTKEYNALFRSLAEKHKEIMHSSENLRFVRMTLSSDPIQRVLDMKEFTTSIKNRIKDGYFLVLQNYEAGYGENNGDHTVKKLFGAFLVLRKADVNNPDDQEDAYSESERIGEEIMGGAIHLINNFGDKPGTRIGPKDVTSDQVAQIALQYYGTRFDFSFSLPANKTLKFKPEVFNG